MITSLSPGGGEKMSKHAVVAGDVAGLLARFAELKRKAQARTGQSFPIIVIEEAGLDGFWIHRVLEAEGIESHVVDPASIATSRRAPPRKDRQDRRRGAGPGFAGLQARRATGVCDAPGAGARGGGPSPHHA